MDTDGYKYNPTERKVYFQGQPTEVEKMIREALIHKESLDKLWPLKFFSNNVSSEDPEVIRNWSAANSQNENIYNVMTSMEQNHGFPKRQVLDMIDTALRSAGNDSTKVDLAPILELIQQKGW